MELTDLQPIQEWIAFERRLCEIFNVDANVFNTRGIRISDHKVWKNKLCPAIKATDKGQSFICAVAHMNIAAISQNTRKPAVEECDAGLAKIVVPIIVDDTFIGAVGSCGVMREDGEVESFLVNKITEIDENEVDRLSEGIPTISQEKIDALIAFVQKEIDAIVENYKKKEGCHEDQSKRYQHQLCVIRAGFLSGFDSRVQ